MFDSVDEKKWGSDDSDLRRSAAESGATDSSTHFARPGRPIALSDWVGRGHFPQPRRAPIGEHSEGRRHPPASHTLPMSGKSSERLLIAGANP
jgi:hypothetical protein